MPDHPTITLMRDFFHSLVQEAHAMPQEGLPAVPHQAGLSLKGKSRESDKILFRLKGGIGHYRKGADTLETNEIHSYDPIELICSLNSSDESETGEWIFTLKAFPPDLSEHNQTGYRMYLSEYDPSTALSPLRTQALHTVQSLLTQYLR